MSPGMSNAKSMPGHRGGRCGVGDGRQDQRIGGLGSIRCRRSQAQKASFFDAREYDAIVASGEQVTSGLLAIALQSMGVDARSWQGWQIPVKTDNAHAAARIVDIDGSELIRRFEMGQVAVVAGFQGVGPDNRLATLGRGGSDTSAVAIAAAVKADRCDIYTDVDGVYTTDPRIEPKARRMKKIAFEEMLEMASLGAKVLQVRSVELAMVHKVRTFVRSSFEDPDAPGMGDLLNPPGTLICDEEEIVEQEVVTGIAYAKDEAQISLRRLSDRPGVSAAIFGPLADAHINVDMIVQNISEDGSRTDMTFTVPSSDAEKALAVLERSERTDRLRCGAERIRTGQGVRHRHRHAQPCRRGGERVQGACGEVHQYQGHNHFRDQDLDPYRRRLCRTRCKDFAFRLRSG
jgi:aspartate kinase